MTDPLSISVGIVGILTAATQISSSLLKFVRSVKVAPTDAEVVLSEVNDIRAILAQLEPLLTGNGPNTARASTSLRALRVDLVIPVISSCVLTFSQLDELLDRIKAGNANALNRVLWVRNEAAIKDLARRLQNHKASLSLMLIIQQSDAVNRLQEHGQQNHQQLEQIVQQQYQDMTARMEQMEYTFAQYSMRRSDANQVEVDNISITTVLGPSLSDPPASQAALDMHQGDTVDDNSSIFTATGRSSFPSAASERSSIRLLQPGFYWDLQNSWVYSRTSTFDPTAQRRFSRDAQSITTSCLAGLSIADISNISVLNLVVDRSEVHNPQYYTDVNPSPMRQPTPTDLVRLECAQQTFAMILTAVEGMDRLVTLAERPRANTEALKEATRLWDRVIRDQINTVAELSVDTELVEPLRVVADLAISSVSNLSANIRRNELDEEVEAKIHVAYKTEKPSKALSIRIRKYLS